MGSFECIADADGVSIDNRPKETEVEEATVESVVDIGWIPSEELGMWVEVEGIHGWLLTMNKRKRKEYEAYRQYMDYRFLSLHHHQSQNTYDCLLKYDRKSDLQVSPLWKSKKVRDNK